MDDVTYAKLKAYIEVRGFVRPLVVRPQGERFQILGGFHRWRVAKELRHTTVPCSVVDLGDRDAKILSINLNELKGEPVQALFARLVHDLSGDLSIEDLESHLPYSEAELRDALELTRVTDALTLDLDEAEAEAEATRPKIVSFVIEDDEEKLLDEAIARASQAAGGVSRAKSLMLVVRHYLGGVDGGS
jgi:ParB-like chromosome segregation protein Spo0J